MPSFRGAREAGMVTVYKRIFLYMMMVVVILVIGACLQLHTKTSINRGRYMDNLHRKSPYMVINESRTRIQNKFLTILWANNPGWLSVEDLNSYIITKCPYRNCRMTTNRQNIKKMAAIIFSMQNQLPTGPLFFQSKRRKDQVWVFLRKEPPTIIHLEWYHDPRWRNTMNWSWGYRTDSDIFAPQGKLYMRKRPLRNRNYSFIYKKKTRDAAWVVSNCQTQSRRRFYVEQLQKFGVSVDKFGECSDQERRVPFEDIKSIISANYKFYLAFESSFCKDYITEKFFRYFQLDVIPLVRGAVNYSRYLDTSTFINTADFTSVEEVAEYIKMVGNNEKIFTDFLRAKDKYESTSVIDEFYMSACELCMKLNNVEKYPNVYEDIGSYINNNTCYSPRDIP